MNRLFIFLFFALLLPGCQEKNIADELDEKLEKSQRDFDQHAREAMEKLNQLQKDSFNLNKVEPLPGDSAK